MKVSRSWSITIEITVNHVTEHGCAIHYKQKYVEYQMNRKCSMIAAYIMMLIVPFSGDIFSAAVQMTVKTVIPVIAG
jgi:hypothetical protein